MSKKRRKSPPRSRLPAGKSYQRLVADIAQAFDTAATVEEGKWVQGPDGRLDMDVAIRGRLDGAPVSVVIECKDFDPKATGKVGRNYVDALDSKRHDLGVGLAIICSNAGFTRDALSKARRKGIGMISVLKRGDSRVRGLIEKEIFLRRVHLGPFTITYHGQDDTLQRIRPTAHDLTYIGRSLDSWLQHRASIVATANPDVSEPLKCIFRFKSPLEFQTSQGPVTLTAAQIVFSYATEWLSQIVKLDASTGIYDYLRGRVRLAPGRNQYVIEGVNFDTATPVDKPDLRQNDSLGLAQGEAHLSLTMAEGLNLGEHTELPDLESLVLDEDLSPVIEGGPNPWSMAWS